MDINQAFRQAEQAFQHQRFADAASLLSAILKQTGPHPAVLHLLGLSQKNLGDFANAAQTLSSAAKAAPADAQITNNLGNVLRELKRPQDAVAHYRKAITQNPQLDDAKLNLAICLHELAQYIEAAEIFADLTLRNPNIARLWRAYGALLLDQHQFADAKAAFDKALAIIPDHPKAVAGRAKAALEMGEKGALDMMRTARIKLPDDPDLLINYSHALVAERDPSAGDELERAVKRRPEWIEGQKALSAVYWELGREQDYTAIFEKSLAEHPDNDALRLALCNVYTSSDDYRSAYRVASGRTPASQNIALLTQHATFASQIGEKEEASRLFEQIPAQDLSGQLQKAKHMLRCDQPDAAAQLLEPLYKNHPDNISIWSFCDISWRMTGDERHHWLHGQPNLYAPRELEMDAGKIAEIAEFLRALHGAGHEPLGQSLRDGTQTKGYLLEKPEPLIAELKQAIIQAVAAHWAGLPPEDAAHPLLKHRNTRPILKGSWSVRLTDHGFHVQHIHPEGLLSSACYLHLPAECEDKDTKPGWLELGRAAPDLNFDLDPIAQIQPAIGRIILFPSTLFHGTRPFNAGERITVAFDVNVI